VGGVFNRGSLYICMEYHSETPLYDSYMLIVLLGAAESVLFSGVRLS
jgi:hypothetical protein